jgi:hypothetical protein
LIQVFLSRTLFFSVREPRTCESENQLDLKNMFYLINFFSGSNENTRVATFWFLYSLLLIKIWIWAVNVWMIFFSFCSFFRIVSLMRFNFYFRQNYIKFKYYLLLMFLQNLSFDRKELGNDRRHNCFRCSCCCLETKTSRNFEIWSLMTFDLIWFDLIYIWWCG